MKMRLTLLLSMLFAVLSALGQSLKDSVFTYVHVMPEAGYDIPQYLSKAINYPPGAFSNGIGGRVVLRFVITETGDIDSVHVMNPIDPSLAAEAIRVVKLMPKWKKPGKDDKGETVKVYFTLPIKFTPDPRFATTSTLAKVKPILGPVYREPDIMPYPPSDLLTYFSEYGWYPEDARTEGASGEVMVQFIVNVQGEIDSIKMLQFVHPSIDVMVMNTLDQMPLWKPGVKNGLPANVYYTLTLKFGDGRMSVKQLTHEPISGRVYDYVDQMPEPGFDIPTYISSHVQSFLIEELTGLKGRTILRFVVDKKGDIDSIKVLKSLHPIIDTFAIALVENMPLWKPGINEGKAVNVYYTLPIPFNFSTDTLIEDSIRRTPEILPEPGYDIPTYLSQNIQYPSDALENKATGRVVLKFVVEKTGEISNIQVVKSVYPSIDAEAIRVVKLMPKWNPGIDKGKRVRTYFTIPIKFSLQ